MPKSSSPKREPLTVNQLGHFYFGGNRTFLLWPDIGQDFLDTQERQFYTPAHKMEVLNNKYHKDNLLWAIAAQNQVFYFIRVLSNKIIWETIGGFYVSD
jgi:hypothetical protein